MCQKLPATPAESTMLTDMRYIQIQTDHERAQSRRRRGTRASAGTWWRRSGSPCSSASSPSPSRSRPRRYYYIDAPHITRRSHHRCPHPLLVLRDVSSPPPPQTGPRAAPAGAAAGGRRRRGAPTRRDAEHGRLQPPAKRPGAPGPLGALPAPRPRCVCMRFFYCNLLPRPGGRVGRFVPSFASVPLPTYLLNTFPVCVHHPCVYVCV